MQLYILLKIRMMKMVELLEKLKNKIFGIREDSISYPCKDKIFTFKDFKDRFGLEITQL